MKEFGRRALALVPCGAAAGTVRLQREKRKWCRKRRLHRKLRLSLHRTL